MMCEVLNADGSVHNSNNRAACVAMSEKFLDEKPWFGIEQEYTFYNGNNPLHFQMKVISAPG